MLSTGRLFSRFQSWSAKSLHNFNLWILLCIFLTITVMQAVIPVDFIIWKVMKSLDPRFLDVCGLLVIG